MGVNRKHKAYTAAADQWSRCRDCFDGGDAVKAADHKYLPPLPTHLENPEKYKEYKLRALFYNATGRTVEGLSGAIFQKAPTVTLPKALEDQLKDVTLTGVSADSFALKSTREVLVTGRYGVLVDMSGDAAAEQRPYWVGYRAEDIVSWRTTRRGGDQVLTRVVLREIAEEPDPKDQFGTVDVEQYRVLELIDVAYVQTIWRKGDVNKDEWAPWTPTGQTEPELIPERRGKPLDFIPFEFLGPTSNLPEVEKPPLLDLVDVNLSHYRTMADLEHGRHYVALPTPWVAGLVGDKQGPLKMGPSVVWELEATGKAGMVEFTGQGLGALDKASEEKRHMMATLGARLLEEQPAGHETATAVEMRHAGEHASLRTVAQSVETGLTTILRWHAWWMGIEATPEDVDAAFELNKEFFSIQATADDVKAALLAYQADAISFLTFYDRLQKGGWAREDVSAEDERKEIERQAPPAPPPDPNAPPPIVPGAPPVVPPAPPGPPAPAPPQPAAR